MAGRILPLRSLPRRTARWIWAFFRLDRTTLIVAAVLLVLSSGAGGMAGYQGYRFAWISPLFCYACHVHDYAISDWQHSIHGDVVTCHDCHRVPLSHYVRDLVHTFYDRPKYPEDLTELPRIPSKTCESCHVARPDQYEDLSSPMPEEVFAEIVRIDQSPAHRLHMLSGTRDPGEARGGEGGAPRHVHRLTQDGPTAGELGFGPGAIECIDCHGTEINRYHNFFARDDNCKQCHEDLTVRGEHLSQFDCRHCHFQDFLPPYEVVRSVAPDEPLRIKDPVLQ